MTRRGPFGFPYTVDPGIIRGNGTDVIASPAANEAFYMRVRDAGPITKIGLTIGTQSGNICVGVHRNTGKGRTAVPGALVSTSGAVACPAAGYREISLGTPCFVREGDWFGLSVDNTTVTVGVLLTAANATNAIGNGRQCRQLTAHPLPTTPSGLASTVGYTFVLVGVA